MLEIEKERNGKRKAKRAEEIAFRYAYVGIEIEIGKGDVEN